jgi:hypothetical protein
MLWAFSFNPYVLAPFFLLAYVYSFFLVSAWYGFPEYGRMFITNILLIACMNHFLWYLIVASHILYQR